MSLSIEIGSVVSFRDKLISTVEMSVLKVDEEFATCISLSQDAAVLNYESLPLSCLSLVANRLPPVNNLCVGSSVRLVSERRIRFLVKEILGEDVTCSWFSVFRQSSMYNGNYT